MSVSLVTLSWTGFWLYINQMQKDHINKLSKKYFDEYNDEELVSYDQIQRNFMLEN